MSYKKINGEWYRTQCIDCGTWLKGIYAKRCKPCHLKTRKGKIWVTHNIPHTQETKDRISEAKLKGKPITYSGLHSKLRRIRRANKCENLDCTDKSKFYDWASMTKEYKTIDEFVELCKSCHTRFDKGGIKPRIKS